MSHSCWNRIGRVSPFGTEILAIVKDSVLPARPMSLLKRLGLQVARALRNRTSDLQALYPCPFGVGVLGPTGSVLEPPGFGSAVSVAVLTAGRVLTKDVSIVNRYDSNMDCV